MHEAEVRRVPLSATVARWLFVGLCVSLVWSATVMAFGTLHPFEVTSGHSMLPTLRTGDVAVIRGVAPWQLRVGEIVAVHVPPADQREYHYPPEIVHRISSMQVESAGLTIQTKGDNQGPDPFTVPASAVSGRMLLAVPYVGYGFLFFESRPGRIAAIGLIVLALIYWGASVLLGDGQMAPPAAAEGQGSAVAPLPGWGEEARALVLAMHEYGEHLRSHTRVVRELGDTTAELRQAASSQNDILTGLRVVVEGLAAPAAAAPLGRRAERRQGARRHPAPPVPGGYPPRRHRRRGRHGG